MLKKRTNEITPQVPGAGEKNMIRWRERLGKRKHQTIFLERTREGHRQSDEHWNCFKGNIRETSERQGGAHMGFSKCIDTI